MTNPALQTLRSVSAMLIVLWFGIKQVYSQDSLRYENDFSYIVEAVSYSTPQNTSHTDFLGKILNYSKFRLGKHSLNLGLMITHDNQPSLFRVRDLQVFSNIEAGNLYGFHEAYYQYESDKLLVKIGTQDINHSLFITDNGSLFTHSSMGIDPVATVNMPAPTYPFTAFGITADLKINKHFRLRAGFFDGQFQGPRNRFLPLSWKMNSQEGFIHIVEPEITFLKNRIQAKFGVYRHTGRFATIDNSGLGDFWGFYSISDIVIHEIGNKSVHFYHQFNTSTKLLSDIKAYYGAGVRLVNVFPIQCENELGIGFANASVNSEYDQVRTRYDIHGETVIEVNWKAKINEKLSLQPYFQYINIREIDFNLKEPIVVALRAYLSL